MIDNDVTVMYKTLFKLMNHDTRNTFVKLEALLSELDNIPVKDMISDSIKELYEIIAASSGFIDGKKRIMSLYDIVSDLSLTEDKITLTNHHRIKMVNDPKVYLFIEVSELFHHAILNIVENALKYSPSEEIVEVSLIRESNSIIVEVKDRGIGISDEDKKHIFNQGFRTERVQDYQGTGIGLWITKNIVTKDSGTIEVFDNDDKGSIFRITIPIYFTDNIEDSMDIILNNYIDDPLELDKCLKSVKTLLDLHKPPKEYHYDSLVFANLLNYVRTERRDKSQSHFKEKLLEIKSRNPHGKTVLIVDDSAYVHYYLGSFFCDLGYRVVEYGFNGEEGYNLYDIHKPDIVTLDITMPVMSGIEASDKILEINPDANILFLSGLGSHKGVVDSISKRLNGKEFGILSKPFTADNLKESLKLFKL